MSHASINDESWWSRPSGGREVLRIALPMVASTLSWTLMSFLDSAFLFFYVSPAAMSASFTASVTWFAALSLCWGICSYTSTFVSQYHGDGQPEGIGASVWQGVWLALAFTPLVLSAIPLAGPLFGSLHDAETADLEARFFRVLCWGAPGMLAAQAFEGFFSGRGRTSVVMCVDATAVLINVALDFLWVAGWGGVEPWGVEGAASATVVAQWSRAALFATLLLRPANRRKYNTAGGARFDGPMIRRLLRFGGPSGVQMLLDIGGFTAFVLLVGRLGATEREATSLVFRVSQLAFMPVWGFGIATTVLVGQRLGEDRPDLAARAARTTLTIALAYMGLISMLFVAAPAIFLTGFIDSELSAASQSQAVRDLAMRLMRFVAAYNMFDATLIIFSSVLRGAGDTRFIMKVSMVSCIALIVATAIGVEQVDAGVYGCWTIITAWIWLLAVVYLARFRQGRWRSMRVIDQKHRHSPPLEESEQGAVNSLLGGELSPAAD